MPFEEKDFTAEHLSRETLLRVLNLLHKLNFTHYTGDIFTTVYESFLSTYDKGRDVGQLFTPKIIKKAILRNLDITDGIIVFDPACGTGGLLIEALIKNYQKEKGEQERKKM